MIFKKVFFFTTLAMLLFSTGFLSGYMVKDYLVEAQPDFPVLIEAYDIIKKYGINELPAGPRIEYGMIHGMVRAYGDPYTLFVEPIQHELESNTLQGAFGGIGVDLERDSDGQIWLNPYPGSPAEKVGVKEGDILVLVDDNKITADTTKDAVIAWLRGPVGEIVKILISRGDDSTPYEFQITRIEFPIPSVAYHLDVEDKRIGIIAINLIAASTPEELTKAIEDLKLRGARAFILDLRDNYGGLLSAGVDVARLFLEEGIIIEQEKRTESKETYSVEHPGEFLDFPVVIIINQNTASAAEIVAGALKAHARGLLVGNPSMGKDSIQLVFELSDGSSLHVTAAKWEIPGLEPSVGEAGLQPDVLTGEISSSNGYDKAVAAARVLVAGKLTP